MFTFRNLFQAAAGLSLIMLIIHLVVGGGLLGAVIWSILTVLGLCLANACKKSKG